MFVFVNRLRDRGSGCAGVISKNLFRWDMSTPVGSHASLTFQKSKSSQRLETPFVNPFELNNKNIPRKL